MSLAGIAAVLLSGKLPRLLGIANDARVATERIRRDSRSSVPITRAAQCRNDRDGGRWNSNDCVNNAERTLEQISPPLANAVLDQGQHDKLARYLDLLLEANATMNLTRRSPIALEAEVHHVGDALTLSAVPSRWRDPGGRRWERREGCRGFRWQLSGLMRKFY